MTDRSEFKTEGYRNHNRIRLGHLAGLGLDLINKNVLELGAGIGDHTEFWTMRGCKVTCVEARKSNLEILQNRHPTANVIHADLEERKTFPMSDIVYAYGILYHLRDPVSALLCWQYFADLLLLETVVARDAFTMEEVEENIDDPTAGISLRATWLPRDTIINTLSCCFPYVYVPVDPPELEEYPKDWNELPPEGLVRAVFIASRKDLSHNPKLELIRR